MPDARQGYGLPIGGALATKGVVFPFAVGMDIACRMRLTVLDLPTSMLAKKQNVLARAIGKETSFGARATFSTRKEHQVMDADWGITRLARGLKDKACNQLGTSGSVNHFVGFGELTLSLADLGLKAGTYLALLSHSGNRGTCGAIAEHHSRLARELHPELPNQLQPLAWLDLQSEEGQECWNAMELMGLYSAADHCLIHRDIADHLGAEVLLDVENHHNGEEMVVHRKGATPAGKGGARHHLRFHGNFVNS